MNSANQRLAWRIFWIAVLVLLGVAGAAFAQDATDPPGRVAYLSYRQGGVVYAPQGDDEWIELPQNRPLTTGDRLWTDRGARAELQLGAATMQVDGESHLGVSDLDERSAQFILQQGSINLRVRDLAQGENVEIDTPNLALRALQPGDYRIDVDPQDGQTRVTVQSGVVSLFGEGGESIHLGAGQQASFAGRYLAQVQGPEYRLDDFALWAAERNRLEDESIAARHLPRGVVGYSQLDAYGTWSQDPNYGAVWYPTVTVANWAPYRYGHWDWVAPWGWTWVDDAPWGFAPFHYGRWAMIGSRWCWVPGRLVARPVYSPALVVFLGGGGTRVALSSGPAVGWYPLAPGEAWWPVYRASPRYVSYANFNINLNVYPRSYRDHLWRNRPFAVTAVGEDDFRHGRPVYRHWQPLAPQAISNAQINVVPVRPELRHRGEFQRRDGRLQAAPPAAVALQPPRTLQPAGSPLPMRAPQPAAAPQQPARTLVPAGAAPQIRTEPPASAMPQPRTLQPAGAPQRFWGAGEAPPAVREQFRAQREQDRLQREAERAAREQRRAAEQVQQQQDLRVQREQLLRQQQEQAARLQGQRDAAQRADFEQAMRRRQQEREQAMLRAQQEHQREVARPQPQPQPQGGRQWPPQRAMPQQQVQAASQVQVPQQQVRPVQQPAPAPQQARPPMRPLVPAGGGEHGARRGDDPPGQGQGPGGWRGQR